MLLLLLLLFSSNAYILQLDPILHSEACGMSRPSRVCDPNRILENPDHVASILDFVNTVDSGCMNTRFNIMLLVMKISDWQKDNLEELHNFMRLTYKLWNIDNMVCETGYLIVAFMDGTTTKRVALVMRSDELRVYPQTIGYREIIFTGLVLREANTIGEFLLRYSSTYTRPSVIDGLIKTVIGNLHIAMNWGEFFREY